MKNMIASALALAAVIATQVPAGVEFTASIASGPKDQATARGWVEGPNAKIEFSQASAGMPQGSYMLTTDGGKTLYMVNPREKSYMKADPAQMAGAVGQIMDATKGFMNMTFSNPTVETLADEKGPAMHGMPTRRVKTRTAYTMETSVFGRKSVTHIEREDETWVTTALRDPGLKLWSRQQTVRTGNAEIDKLIELESAKVDGFPLKTVSVNRSRDARGREETTTATHEITSISKASIPAAVFVLPADYTDAMAELGEELRKAKAGMEESDEPPPPEVKGAVDSIMKGIFGGGRR